MQALSWYLFGPSLEMQFIRSFRNSEILHLQALSWYLLAGRAGADRACCLLARAAEIYLMDNAGEYTDVLKQEYKKYHKVK